MEIIDFSFSNCLAQTKGIQMRTSIINGVQRKLSVSSLSVKVVPISVRSHVRVLLCVGHHMAFSRTAKSIHLNTSWRALMTQSCERKKAFQKSDANAFSRNLDFSCNMQHALTEKHTYLLHTFRTKGKSLNLMFKFGSNRFYFDIIYILIVFLQPSKPHPDNRAQLWARKIRKTRNSKCPLFMHIPARTQAPNQCQSIYVHTYVHKYIET